MSSDEESDDGSFDLNICPADDRPDAPHVERPSWRLPPDESHSDFVIAVSIEPEIDGGEDDDGRSGDASSEEGAAECTEYHVHKERLCVGPWSSALLAGALRGNTTEAVEGRYAIVLKQSAADAFPALLDCMYTRQVNFYGDYLYSYGTRSGSTEHECVAITYKHCVALRFLTSYFGMERLHRKVNGYISRHSFLPSPRFCGGKQTIDALVYTWNESIAYCDEKMQAMLKQKTAQLLKENHIFDQSIGELLLRLPFDIIKHVWDSPWISSFLEDDKKIVILARALRDHHHEINDKVMALVISRLSLPNITSSAAMDMLKVLSDINTESPEWDGFREKMKDLEQRCCHAVADNWEDIIIGSERWGTDYNDESLVEKKRQKIEASCTGLSAEIERKVLMGSLGKACKSLASERMKWRTFLNEYIDLGQSVQDHEFSMQWPKHSMFIFGESWVAGCYRLYSYEMDREPGTERVYMKQGRYRYDSYGHMDDRGHCTLKYNGAEACWEISVRYRERDVVEGQTEHLLERRYKSDYIEKVLFEAPRQNESTDIPKLGWKDKATGEKRPDILALEFEDLRKVFNPSFMYNENDRKDRWGMPWDSEEEDADIAGSDP